MTRTILLIENEALARIKADAARFAGRKERGGVFLGTRRGPHLQVTEATLPMRWDWGSMFSFRRSARGHQDVALRRWRDSEETTDWIGEWHSHPQAIPEPSSIDLNSWRSMTEERGAPMAFLIVGYDGLWAGICLPGLSLPIRYVQTEQSPDGTAFQAA